MSSVSRGEPDGAPPPAPDSDTWDSVTAEAAEQLVGPIVVFGASGFIGANLVRSLLRRRSDVYAITHKRQRSWRTIDLPNANVRVCNLLSRDETSALVESLRPQTVFNLAAYGAYARQDDPALIHATNFASTEHLLRQLRQTGFHAYVHAGSSSEYGTNASGPDESAALEPNSDYAVSKVAASYLIQYYGRHHKVPCLNLRLYSVYGPYEDPGRLIPSLIREGMTGRFPPLVDPSISRDFIYVDDATAAFVLAAALGVRRAAGRSLNIASGQRVTIADLAEVAREIFGIKARPEFSSMPNRRWDLAEWFGNAKNAKEVLGWQSTTGLREGLKRTRDWYVAQPKYHIELAAKRKKLSAIIACYKDAQAIPLMHQRLAKVMSELDVDYEIIFVNDCSPDDTSAVLAEITRKDPNVIAVEHTRNFGSQSAFSSGMELASGDAVILLDGDLQDPPELISAFYAKWIEGYDVVYGVRKKREATMFMRAAAKLFYRVFRRLAYVDVPLDSGDFSLLSRPVVDQLIALPERDQFLRGLRAWVGFRQAGVPYVRPERAFGVSTNNLRKNIWWAKKGIFSFSYAPLEIMGYTGLAVTVLGLAWAIYISVQKLLDPQIPRGFTSVTVTILFVAGVQLLSLSVIGEYIAKIFEEVKGRPKFIRRSVTVGKKVMNTEAEVRAFIEDAKVVDDA